MKFCEKCKGHVAKSEWAHHMKTKHAGEFKKVYCGECGWLENLTPMLMPFYQCNHPQNRKDTFMNKDAGYRREPKEINEINDCEWFKKKKLKKVKSIKSGK